MSERYALGSKKMLAMGILEILKDYTDYDHRLTQQQIIELLDKNYGMVCDRKSVKNNIKLQNIQNKLRDFFFMYVGASREYLVLYHLRNILQPCKVESRK